MNLSPWYSLCAEVDLLVIRQVTKEVRAIARFVGPISIEVKETDGAI